MSFLGALWFCLAALLLLVWAVLDGFDLGAGMLYGLERDPRKRAAILGTISPVWNGNEVWLVAGIGSLLAGFPPVYSRLLSTLYIPVMLVLTALIFRGAGVELRGKAGGSGLAGLLDLSIGLGSLIPAWAAGYVGGMVLRGLPVAADGSLPLGLAGLLDPWAMLAGLCSAAAFAVHGALWLALRLPEEFRKEVEWRSRGFLALLAVLALLLAATAPWALAARLAAPGSMTLFWIFGALVVLGWVGIYVDQKGGHPGRAFIASILGLLGLVGASASLLFPVLLPSRLDPAANLTVANAAAPPSTQVAMLIAACVGLPLVLVYAIVAYRAFRGRAPIKEE